MAIAKVTIMKQLKEEGMILPGIQFRRISALYAFSIAVTMVVMMTFAVTSFAAVKQKTFTSPEEAVNALITAGRNNDNNEILAVFGADAKDLLFSGDEIADKQRREDFLAKYDEQHKMLRERNTAILVIGKNEFPFPIPLVKKGETWFFDTKQGKEEVLNRRIGENELYSIQTCLAIVDAQREYAILDRDGDNLHEYAEKFASDPGKKNGLYWETKEGEAPSPLGKLLVQAKAEGYSKKDKKGPLPYHSYYYRIIKAQGKNAPGGAYDYVIKGNMIGGFAVVAYPSKYGNSGVMTFIVNHDGMVYQKNIGNNTTKIAKAITKYDPDKTWEKTK